MRQGWFSAALAAAMAVLAVGCVGSQDRGPAGAEQVGGGGDVQPTQLALTRPAPADVVIDLATTPAISGESESESEPAPPEPVLRQLPGAERLGGGGTIHPNVAPLEFRIQGASLDELDLYEATAVAVDPDGAVWVLVHGEPGSGRTPIAHAHRATALRVVDDQVERARSIPGGSDVWLLTAEPGDPVQIGALAYGDVAEAGEIGEVGGTTDLKLLALDPAEDRAIRVAREDVVQVGALAITLDGSLIAGRDDSTRIYAISRDGDVRQLLGFSVLDPDAEVQLDETLGEVRSLVALPDGRVAFVTQRRGENALRLLDGEQVRTIDSSPQDRDRQVQSITAGPDGQLLAVAAGADTHPQIWVIDVDTGETEVVADLEGVLPHPEGPRGIPGALWGVAAATDGEDLVFLADGHLWRLPDAFE